MATAAFLNAWRSADLNPALLAQIDFSQPSARTLRAASRPGISIEGVPWEPLIASASRIRAPGGYLTPRLSPCSTELTLLNAAAGFQSGEQTIADLAVAYQWEGAAIKLYLWEMSLSAFADACQVFAGLVNRVSIAVDTTEVMATEDERWARRPVTQHRVQSSAVVPEHVRGQVFPVIYGDHRARGMRAPWTDSWSGRAKFEDLGAGRYVLPAVVANSGSSGSKPQVVIADHLLWAIPDSEFPP